MNKLKHKGPIPTREGHPAEALLTVRIPADELAAAKACAKAHQTTLGMLVRSALKEF